ncbi:MAG TPA: CPBP family intramembrane glutamic endopeptidase [Chitinispirillaceae bacterium]|nr:CPBP family intramembrane glutamic endopeptidase [Chitinispirillaceae bacterium]
MLTIFCRSAYGQSDDSISAIPSRIPTWTLLLPGATQFYDGRITEGLTFSLLETACISSGLLLNKSLRNGSSSPYYNYPLFLGLQLYQTEKMLLIYRQLDCLKQEWPDFRYDNISERDLYLSPFALKNIFTPITGGMAGLAALFLGINHHYAMRHFRDVRKLYVLDHYADRNQAMALYGTVSLAMSWGAGVSEEYAFRNWLLPVLDYRFGRQKGLVISSLLFGSAHFSNLLFSGNPDIISTLIQVGEASLIGFFCGLDVQRRGYSIGPAVAAHTWYDFILMAGSFFADPQNNIFGVNVQFDM